jgi:hypothetical protein
MAHSSPIATLAEVERHHILETLCRCEGNKTHAAKILGVSLRGLRNKLRIYEVHGHCVVKSTRNQVLIQQAPDAAAYPSAHTEIS